MKLSKLMLAAFVAVLALASCNKQDTTPQANRLKSVEISLENVLITKGLAGDKIQAGDAVVVNDLKIFLTDASGNEYDAKVSDGSAAAQSYFTGVPAETVAFHYVDPNCTKVVAVANLGKDITFAEYKALAALNIEDQQDATALVLYDEATLTSTTREHNDAAADGTTYLAPVYEAELTLTPRVSRFEVDGFTVKFNATPKYNEVKITQLAFLNYYGKTTVVEGTESDLVASPVDFTNQSEVYAWLDNGQTAWYRDTFEVVITPEDNVQSTPKPLAYHMFSCSACKSCLIIKHESLCVLLILDLESSECLVLSESDVLAKVSNSNNLSTIRIYIVESYSLSRNTCEIALSRIRTVDFLCIIFISGSVSQEDLDVIYLNCITSFNLIAGKTLCDNDVLERNLY